MDAASETEDWFQPLFQLEEDRTPYRPLALEGLDVVDCGGERVLRVAEDLLAELARRAFFDLHHLFRPSHLAQLRAILDDPEASAGDRFVALELLKNAVISAAREYPSCQDTGTAIVVAKKGQMVWTRGDDVRGLSAGIRRVYREHNLRYSQLAPLSTFAERNTGDNLPAQIDIEAVPGREYRFLFIAKGGGSANKTFLFQETPRLLEPERMLAWLEDKIARIGTTACPPYHLAVVVGGLSAEQALKVVKLASCRELDGLPTTGSPRGRAFRDLELEQRILAMTRELGIGAQFGGKYYCHDVRVVRLPRHGASLPIAIGVSCSADRQIKAKITEEGVFLEQLETDPARYLPEVEVRVGEAVRIDLRRPMADIRAQLGRLEVGTPLVLDGPLVVARDLAHKRIAARLAEGGELPAYMKEHPIYYAGPAKTPEGRASGSFGPTTAARMDPYIPLFQAHGGALVTLAKGNRGREVAESCRRYGGFYLATIGGAAARVGRDMITRVELIDFEDLGMEAVWRIEVRDMPAFLVIDDKGRDFWRVRVRAGARMSGD